MRPAVLDPLQVIDVERVLGVCNQAVSTSASRQDGAGPHSPIATRNPLPARKAKWRILLG